MLMWKLFVVPMWLLRGGRWLLPRIVFLELVKLRNWWGQTNYCRSKISCWSPILCHFRGVDHCSDFPPVLRICGVCHPPSFILVFCQVGVPAGVMWCWRLANWSFSCPFLNLSGCHFMTRVCFAAEWIGICHFSWLLFRTAPSPRCCFVMLIPQFLSPRNSL
jgi:hypothetical protein